MKSNVTIEINGNRHQFELEWAESGWLKIIHASGKGKGKMFHCVDGEGGLRSFVELTLGGQIVGYSGEELSRPLRDPFDPLNFSLLDFDVDV